MGWFATGEWMNYTIAVPSAGTYTVALRVASSGGGSLHVGFNLASNVWQPVSVPNEAIIEEGDRRLVYVQQGDQYLPQEIKTGIQGELYTQILDGLTDGNQVVTFGSFFIDSEFKLKGAAQAQK